MFVLLGRDKATPATIRFWVNERIRLGKNTDIDDQIKQALLYAQLIETQLLEKELLKQLMEKKDGSTIAPTSP